MSEKVLNEDWSDYDDRKIRDSRDAKYFACDESWEREYLIKKIRSVYNYERDTIAKAIDKCCESVPAPRPRKQFVECVMRRLQG